MARVRHFGFGVYCEVCQQVYDGTNGCGHDLDQKMGVQPDGDEYLAQPANMAHYSPHQFIEVEGMEQCAECGAVKIPSEMVKT